MSHEIVIRGTPGQVDPAIIHHPGIVFVPVTVVVTFGVIAITILSFYDSDRSRHLRNIQRLEGGDESDRIAAANTDPPDAEIAPVHSLALSIVEVLSAGKS